MLAFLFYITISYFQLPRLYLKPVESWQVVYALLIKIVPHEYPLHDNRGYFAGKG